MQNTSLFFFFFSTNKTRGLPKRCLGASALFNYVSCLIHMLESRFGLLSVYLYLIFTYLHSANVTTLTVIQTHT